MRDGISFKLKSPRKTHKTMLITLWLDYHILLVYIQSCLNNKYLCLAASMESKSTRAHIKYLTMFFSCIFCLCVGLACVLQWNSLTFHILFVYSFFMILYHVLSNRTHEKAYFEANTSGRWLMEMQSERAHIREDGQFVDVSAWSMSMNMMYRIAFQQRDKRSGSGSVLCIAPLDRHCFVCYP